MRLLVYGSKEFAGTVYELIRHCGHEAVGMVDDFNKGPGILGRFDDIISSHPPSECSIVVAVGYRDMALRWKIWQTIQTCGYTSPALIHPWAYVADTARIGKGVMVMAGAVVDVRAKIGDLAVIWPGVCINHDASVGENTFVSPNATVCGSAEIGAHSFIGAGAAIVDHCKVPEASFIKMLCRYTGRKS